MKSRLLSPSLPVSLVISASGRPAGYLSSALMKQPDYSQRGAELLRPPACEFPKEELFRLLFVLEEQKVNKELAYIYIYMSSCWLLALARYCAREFSSADSVARQREIGGDRRSKLFPRRRGWKLRSRPCHTIPSETSRSPRKQPLWKNHNLGWQKLNLISEPAGRRFQLLTTRRSIGSRPSCDAVPPPTPTPPPQSLASLSARDAARLPLPHLHTCMASDSAMFISSGGGG